MHFLRQSLKQSPAPLGWVVLAVAVSCGGGGKGAPAQRAASVSCEVKPDGIEPLLVAGAVTVFGEMHGTAQAPGFVGNVACHAVEAGRQVVVGLEIPNDLQPQVDGFLASGGTADDVAALLKGRFWTGQDGRSSKAMVALLDHLRRLGQSGAKVRVFLFDGAFAGAETRDVGMAKNISSAVDETPGAVVLILVGNLHARADTERWMAWHLHRHHPGLRTLNLASSTGSTWVCTSAGCGPLDVFGQDRGSKQFVELAATPDANGYDGVFYVGEPTASPPATSKGDVPVVSPRKRADRAYEAKDYSECARLYIEAAAGPVPSMAAGHLYDAACCQALGGDAESAIQTLQRAIDAGYSNAEHMQSDADLATLHGHARWAALVTAAEAKAKAKVKDPK